MILKIYDENPNYQDILKVVKCLEGGGVIVIPTDTLYAFACSMNYKKAVEKMALLKGDISSLAGSGAAAGTEASAAR